MYFKRLKDCMDHQKKHGGVIWYDRSLKKYYII
jgi:hypothetical protein